MLITSNPSQRSWRDCFSHLSGLLIHFSVTRSFSSPTLMSLMLKELQPFLLFLYREPVSKNRKRRDREQVRLSACLHFIACPERAPGHCRAAGARVPKGGSQEGIQLNPSPPLFPCQSCSLVPLHTAYCSAQGAPRLEPWPLLPPLRPPPPSHRSSHEANSPALPAAAPAALGRWDVGGEKGGRLKVTLPFLFCRAE